MRARDGEKVELCEELEAIEHDLLRQLVELYRKGSDFVAFWEVVDKVRLFSELRKNVCEAPI